MPPGEQQYGLCRIPSTGSLPSGPPALPPGTPRTRNNTLYSRPSRPLDASLSMPAFMDRRPSFGATGRASGFLVPLSRQSSGYSAKSGAGAASDPGSGPGFPLSPRGNASNAGPTWTPSWSPSSIGSLSPDKHRIPSERFEFANQPLRSQVAGLAAPHPGMNYSFLSAPSSSEDMISLPVDQSPDPRPAPFLFPRPGTPPGGQDPHPGWTSPRAPRMTGTGGGYGYISGSAESSLVLKGSHNGTAAGSRGSRASSCDTPLHSSSAGENDPLLALQRLTIDLFQQKHSVPAAPDVTDLSASPACSSNGFFASSSASDQGDSQASGLVSSYPASPSPETNTPSPTFLPTATEEQITATATSPLSTSHGTAILRAVSSPSPSCQPPTHSQAARKRSPRRSITPRFAKRRPEPEETAYEQPIGVGVKRARQPTPASAGPITPTSPAVPQRRSGRVRASRGGASHSIGQDTRYRHKSTPSRDQEYPGAHQIESGVSVCDYVNPITATYCGTRFHRMYDLVRHRETVHGREEALEIRRGNLSPDRAVVWGKEVNPATSNVAHDWRCETCGSTFSRKDAMMRHKRLRSH